MKRFKPFTYFLCVITILFVLLSPALIKEGLSNYSYFVSFQPEEESFNGILTLWHINGWKSESSSIYSYLKRCIGSFEKNNAYVFIEIKSLSIEEASARILSGEKPDLISFPCGFLSDPSLLSEIEFRDPINSNIASCASYNLKTYALPYTFNTYLMYSLNDIFYETDIDPASLGEYNLSEIFDIARYLSLKKESADNKSMDLYGLVVQKESSTLPQCSLPFYVTNTGNEPDLSPEPSTLPDTTGKELLYEPQDGYSIFAKGSAAFMLASQGYLGSLSNESSIPDFSIVSSCDFTDMIQYIGVVKTDDALKLKACKDFANSLLSVKNQSLLSDIGTCPVIYLEEAFNQNSTLLEVYERMLNKGVFPNTFLYAKNISTANKYTDEISSGNLSSLEFLKDIMLLS